MNLVVWIVTAFISAPAINQLDFPTTWQFFELFKAVGMAFFLTPRMGVK
jgi:hypothetical protein